MKLAFCLFKYYPYGGLERDFLRIAQGFAAHGHEIHVFTLRWQGFMPPDFHIHILPIRGLQNHQRAANFSKAVNEILRRQKFDAVIGFNRIAGLDFYFAADLCFAHTAALKHGSWFQYTPRYHVYQQLEAEVFQPAGKTRIFVLTEAVKNTYQAVYGTPESRFIQVPPGIKALNLSLTERSRVREALRQRLNISDPDHQLLLQVGSDFRRKGLDRSLSAIASLPEALQKRLHFYSIGKGCERPYQTLMRKLGIQAEVRFLGARDDVLEFMQAADGLLHPAYHETAGMVLVEALTCGLPVLVTENCGYAFHIKNADAGMVLPSPFYQDHLNQALRRFLQTEKNAWQANALAYAGKTDLYGMADRIFKTVVSTCRVPSSSAQAENPENTLKNTGFPQRRE